jgi:transcriptional regulator with XRE-family HTH domain
LAAEIGIAKSQIYRYEKGATQPTLIVIQDLAIALRVSANELVFGEAGRDLPDDLHHQFEAVKMMSPEDQRTIKSLIEGMIIKYRTREMVGDIRS